MIWKEVLKERIASSVAKLLVLKPLLIKIKYSFHKKNLSNLQFAMIYVSRVLFTELL